MYRRDGSKKLRLEKNCHLNSPDSWLCFLALSWLFRSMDTCYSENKGVMDTFSFWNNGTCRPLNVVLWFRNHWFGRKQLCFSSCFVLGLSFLYFELRNLTGEEGDPAILGLKWNNIWAFEVVCLDSDSGFISEFLFGSDRNLSSPLYLAHMPYSKCICCCCCCYYY